MATAPGAPTLTPTAGRGVVGLTWSAPSSGGATITSYSVDIATNPAFTGESWKSVSGSARAVTFTDLTPGTLYYFRGRAKNSIGYSSYSATVSATTAVRTPLDSVEGASVNVPGGATVSIRSDMATTPVLTLGFSALGDGVTWTPIATLAGFYAPGGANNLTLVSDPLGHVYVVGIDAASHERLRVQYFGKSSGVNAWLARAAVGQSFSSSGEPIVQVAAAYVAGTGGVSSKASIFVLARRAGSQSDGSISYAVASPLVALTGSGSLFLAFGTDPSFLSSPPSGFVANPVLDVAVFPGSVSKVAVFANGFHAVNVVNGVVSAGFKPGSGALHSSAKARVVGVSATVAAYVYEPQADGDLDLDVKFISSAGAQLATVSIPGPVAGGGAFVDQWDVFYNRATGQLSVLYVATDGRTINRVDVSPTTYAASPAVTVTAALGPVSSANGALRLPRGIVNERRLFLEASNLLTGTHSLAVHSDTAGNASPLTPALAPRSTLDALAPAVFAWTFGDSNPDDVQSAYQLRVIRVSDAVVVHDTGKYAFATPSHTIAAGTLVNGVSYQWEVRTYDALDAVSPWSALGAFAAASTGTVTITAPASDGLPTELSSVEVAWTFSQAEGYVQASRRVRLIQVSSGTVDSDTTLEASTATTHVVGPMQSDVDYRIEVTVQSTGPNAPAVATRLLTPSFATPMTPTLSFVVGDSYLDIVVTNPAPTGDRPETPLNDIYKRPAGSDAAFYRIARIGGNGVYRDRAVRSEGVYEYQAVGLSIELLS